MTAHSVLAPSSAYRWIACPGSAQLAALYPEQETEQSREGTAAHWIGAELLTTGLVLSDVAPNGVVLTDEMHKSAQVWVDHVLRTVGQGGGQLLIEQRVNIARIHPECFGTPDSRLWLHSVGHLHVWDFKHGHDPVEAVGNWQLILYVCGILDELGIDGLSDQHLTVHMHVVQPRAFRGTGPIQTWTVKASDLRGYFNTARQAAHVAMSPNAPTKAGTWCLYCPARHDCPTLQKAVLASLTYVGGSAPDRLGAEAAGRELELLRFAQTLIKSRLTGREADVESRITRGEQVPGWTIDHPQGKQRFAVDKDTVLLLGDMAGVDLRKPEDVVTATQALEKFKAAGVDGSVIRPYIERPRGGAVLVPDAGLTEQARRAFGDSQDG